MEEGPWRAVTWPRGGREERGSEVSETLRRESAQARRTLLTGQRGQRSLSEDFAHNIALFWSLFHVWCVAHDKPVTSINRNSYCVLYCSS